MTKAKIIRKVLTDNHLFHSVMRLIKLIIYDFFVPQFQTLFSGKNRHIVRVDGELDREIPFVESKIYEYLSFTSHWISALSWMLDEFGPPAKEDIRSFIRDLSNLHARSAEIYKKIQSTTRRPRVPLNPRYWILYFSDPHVHCVPSLHVSEMALTYMRMKSVIAKYSGEHTRYGPVLQEFFEKEIAIIESVLYTKQHSLNCVAAGLFFLSAVYPEFGEENAKLFIDALFRESDVRIQNPERLRTFIRNNYDEFMRRHQKGYDYRRILIDFLSGFPRVLGIVWDS
ncbi:MAG: hypothetical protein ACLFRY_15375 [Spirochaetia bacterium]